MIEDHPIESNLQGYTNHSNEKKSDVNRNDDFKEKENIINPIGEIFLSNTNDITNEKRDVFLKTINKKEIIQNNDSLGPFNEGNDILSKNNLDKNYEVLKEAKSIELNEDDEEYNKIEDEKNKSKKKFFIFEKNILNMEEKLIKMKSMEKRMFIQNIQNMMKII